jgi:hypothetical protein
MPLSLFADENGFGERTETVELVELKQPFRF